MYVIAKMDSLLLELVEEGVEAHMAEATTTIIIMVKFVVIMEKLVTLLLCVIGSMVFLLSILHTRTIKGLQ